MKQAIDAYNLKNDQTFKAKYNHKSGFTQTQMSCMIDIQYQKKTPQGLLTSQELLNLIKREYVTGEAVCKMKQELLSMKMTKDHNLRMFVDTWEVLYLKLKEICSPDITDQTMCEYLPSASELKKSLFNGLANFAQTLTISQLLGTGSVAMLTLPVSEYVDKIREIARQSSTFIANNVKAEMKSNASSGMTSTSKSVHSRLDQSTSNTQRSRGPGNMYNISTNADSDQNVMYFRSKFGFCMKCGIEKHSYKFCTEDEKKGASQFDSTNGYDKNTDYAKAVRVVSKAFVQCTYCGKNHLGECRFKQRQYDPSSNPTIKMNTTPTQSSRLAGLGNAVPILSRLSGHESTIMNNSSNQTQAKTDGEF